MKNSARMAGLFDLIKSNAARRVDGSLDHQCTLPAACTTSGNEMRCCTRAFERLYGVSSATRVKYSKKVIRNEALAEKLPSEASMARGEAARHFTILWMKDMFTNLCDFLPTSGDSSKDYHLPTCVSKAGLYTEYVEDFNEKKERYGDDYTPYSLTGFTKIWDDEFPYVTIPRTKAFAVCSSCSELCDKILSATKAHNRALLKELKEVRMLHLGFIAKERLAYREHQQRARELPDAYVSLSMDGMDQAKMKSPHFAGNAIPKSMFVVVSCSLVADALQMSLVLAVDA